MSKHRTILDSLMRYARFLGYGDIHTKIDSKTGLYAIVAIHNLRRGPAIGGCRFKTYESMPQAIEDSLRLGYMMSYKAAINNLNHGGGKAVILKPKSIPDPVAFWESFGSFVDELGGRYITAVDSGTSPTEMDIIANRTKFVTCTTISGGEADPSPLTALGVRRGIEAAVKFRLGKDNLNGVHIAIQGAGHVGFNLAKDLVNLGARVTIADIHVKSIQRCIDELNVEVCTPSEITTLKADVFAPCALGAVLNLKTINALNVKVVAGAANNQLAHGHNASVLHERGILYAPDFLINAGGLIHVAVLYDKGNYERSVKQINGIYDTVTAIFEQSKRENRSTHEIAVEIARSRL